MTEPSATVETMPEEEIEFEGRKIFVKMPRPEQILVWKRTLTQLQNADVTGWNGTQVLAALERTRKIIDSVLANQTDVDWMDDEMLAGRLGLAETAALIHLTVEAFQDRAETEGNRAERRAAKKAPAKKAARKTPAR